MKTKTTMPFWAITAWLIAMSFASQAKADPSAVAAADAGTGGSSSNLELPEVYVTATKRETKLLETPVAITAVGQADLDKHSIVNVRALKSLVPNLQIGTLPDSGTAISLRGVGSIDPTEVGEASVALHQDGFYSPRSQGALALIYDVERVEVLRGPQGTLFGQNSPGGTINVIPNKPEFSEYSSNMDIATGTGRDKSARGVVNLGFSDKFALRLTGTFERRDGLLQQERDFTDIASPANGIVKDGIPDVDQRYNTGVSRANYYNNVDEWGVRVYARWRPIEKLEVLAKYSVFVDRSAGDIDYVDCAQVAGTFNACDHPLRWARINVPGKKDMKIEDYQTKIAYNVTDSAVLEYRNGIQIQTRSQREDIDGGAHPAAQWSRLGDPALIKPTDINSICRTLSCYYPVADTYNSTDSSRYYSMGNELQLKSSGNAPLQYVLGAFFFKENKRIRYSVIQPESQSWSFTPADPTVPGSVDVRTPDGLPLLTVYDQHMRTTENRALFGNVDYRLSDKFGVTAGYRHSWDKKGDINGYTLGYFSPDPALYGGSYVPGYPRAHQSNNLTLGMIEGLPNSTLPILTGPSNRTKDWSQSIYKLGAQYHVNADEFLYASYSTGYKMGGFYEDYDTCNFGCFEHQDYNPEYVTSYEVGYKGKLLNNRLHVALDAFVAMYKDIQVTGSFVVGTDKHPGPTYGQPVQQYTTKNIATARISGLEFEFDAIPWENGTLSGFATFTDAKITKSNLYVDGYACFERIAYGQAPCANNPVSFQGNTLPFVPRWSATLNYEHHFDLGSDWVLSPYWSGHYQSMMFLDIENYQGAHLSQTQAGYVKHDAGLKLTAPKERYYVELSAQNLTDIDTKSSDGMQFGRVRGYYDPPRIWSLRLGASF